MKKRSMVHKLRNKEADNAVKDIETNKVDSSPLPTKQLPEVNLDISSRSSD
jgi:hypothetical protein